MPTNRICQICRVPVDKHTFPLRGNICIECEYSYGLDIMSSAKGTVILMGGRNKDWLSAIRYSGNYPLTFNFVLNKNGHHIQCAFCGNFINEKRITRDHIWPKSKGGLIKVPACRNCNEAKADTKPIDFAIWYAKEKRDFAMIPMGYDPEEDDP